MREETTSARAPSPAGAEGSIQLRSGSFLSWLLSENLPLLPLPAFQSQRRELLNLSASNLFRSSPAVSFDWLSKALVA